MSISKLGGTRIANEILNALFSVRRDMVWNASTHVAMAAAQSPDVGTLRQFVTDSAASYLNILGRINAVRSVPGSWAVISPVLATLSITGADVLAELTALANAATALSSASLTSYTEITAACNALLALIVLPDTLFP